MKTIHVTAEEDLQKVLDSAPADATVRLAPGIYRAKIVIRTPGLTLIGAGAGETVIVWDDHARKPHPIGYEYNTFRTWTLAVCADRVTIRDLTVANDAGDPRTKGQQVALSVCGTDFSMENCTLTSTQDTLFLGPLPSDLIGRYEGFLTDDLRAGYPMTQRFENCRIQGTVDFIFGCGEADFIRCEIRSLHDGRDTGYVAAPSHEARRGRGFRFRECAFTCGAEVAPESVYLARPWRDYGMAVFENCRYGSHIAPAGFDPWSGTRRDRTARFYETPPVPGRVDWVKA